MTPNPTLTYAYKGCNIILRYRQLAWTATVEDSDGRTFWTAAGFQDKELAIKAAKAAMAQKSGEKPMGIVKIYKNGLFVGEIVNARHTESAELCAYDKELQLVMELYEEPEDVFAFLRRKGFTLEG